MVMFRALILSKHSREIHNTQNFLLISELFVDFRSQNNMTTEHNMEW